MALSVVPSHLDETFVLVSSFGPDPFMGGGRVALPWSKEPITLASGIVFVHFPDLICRGCINNSAMKFCIKPASGTGKCEVASHNTKVLMKSGLFLLDLTSCMGATCFASPTVHESHLSEDVIANAPV